MTRPPGWPRDLPDPESEEFPTRVVGWLLELCPPGYREHDVLRRHPLILARLACRHAEGTVQSARDAFAAARRELAGQAPAQAVDETLAALAKEGAHLASRAREAALVEQALQGRRWRPKL